MSQPDDGALGPAVPAVSPDPPLGLAMPGSSEGSGDEESTSTDEVDDEPGAPTAREPMPGG